MSRQAPQRVSLRAAEGQEGPLRVRVALAENGYDIIVGAGLLENAGELSRAIGAGAGLLVTDETVARLYGDRCLASLQAGGEVVQMVAVPPGEESKTLAMAERLYEACLEAGLDRGATIYALGGGVIGDLAGFVSGTYMRGIRLVQLPTTLLAQVDASVGGKTAVDLPHAKNVVGVFHQPALVLADVGTLRSLPDREFRSGLAEIVKHAAIADVEMLDFVAEQAEEINARAPEILQRLVARNCQIKAEVVAADPEESGWRAVLNFGHTIGHALERAAPNWALRHGEAVAYGMIMETRLAEEKGLSEAGTAERIAQVLRRLGLAEGRPQVELERAEEALRHDKKLRAGRLWWPVVTRPGTVRLVEGIGWELMAEALRENLEG